MQRDSAKTLFGKDVPSHVVAPETLDAGGQMHEIPAGKPVTPRVLVKAILTDALHELGGVAWVVKFAQGNDGNARVFMQCITKLLPIELTGPGGADLTIIIKKETGETYEGGFQGGRFVAHQLAQQVAQLAEEPEEEAA